MKTKKSTLKHAANEAYELIRDIVNAAGNEQPYTVDELERISTPVFDLLHNALNK